MITDNIASCRKDVGIDPKSQKNPLVQCERRALAGLAGSLGKGGGAARREYEDLNWTEQFREEGGGVEVSAEDVTPSLPPQPAVCLLFISGCVLAVVAYYGWRG